MGKILWFVGKFISEFIWVIKRPHCLKGPGSSVYSSQGNERFLFFIDSKMSEEMLHHVQLSILYLLKLYFLPALQGRIYVLFEIQRLRVQDSTFVGS